MSFDFGLEKNSTHILIAIETELDLFLLQHIHLANGNMRNFRVNTLFFRIAISHLQFQNPIDFSFVLLQPL